MKMQWLTCSNPTCRTRLGPKLGPETDSLAMVTAGQRCYGVEGVIAYRCPACLRTTGQMPAGPAEEPTRLSCPGCEKFSRAGDWYPEAGLYIINGGGVILWAKQIVQVSCNRCGGLWSPESLAVSVVGEK